jgi:hypothetical protein
MAFAKNVANRNRLLEPVHLPLSFFSTITVSAECFKHKAKTIKSCKVLSAKTAENLGQGGKALVHLRLFYSKNFVVNALALLPEHTAKAIAKLAHLQPQDRLNGYNLLLAA